MNFEDMCASVCRRFEPEESKRALIREWDNLSLPLVIQHSPGKFHTECLNKMISRLTEIQTELPAKYYPELMLKNKLLNAVKDVPKYQPAYQKPADSIHGVISDLHSTLATSTTTTAGQAPSLDNPTLHYA